jgi:hypothetical protein
MTADIPRLDYTGGGCPSLLLEPQRTNLLNYSEQFDNAAWTKDGSTATANAATSPDGFTNADKLFETAVTDFHRVFGPTISVTSGTAYTASIFVKAAEVTTFSIELRLTASVGTATFDLVAETASGAGIIQDYGNGWYRCILTATATATGNGRPFFYIKQASSYAGNASNGILIYGAQVEVGSYVSSYIPTLGSSVTRLADVASKTGISSLIGQAAGTVFADFVIQGGDVTQEVLGVVGGGQFIAFFAQTNGNLQFISNIISQKLISTLAFNTRFKVAYSYKAGTHLLYANGIQISSESSASVYSSLSEIYLNTSDVGAGIQKMQNNSVVLYKSALTGAELQSLTAL